VEYDEESPLKMLFNIQTVPTENGMVPVSRTVTFPILLCTGLFEREQFIFLRKMLHLLIALSDLQKHSKWIIRICLLEYFQRKSTAH
jgi:hypothetical protein